MVRKTVVHYKLQQFFVRGTVYLFCIVLACTTFFPFFSMIVSSTHESYEIVTRLNVLPGRAFMANYERLTRNINVWRGMFNSFVVAVAATAITLYFSLLTAYGFSKFRFRGRSFLFSVVLVTMMLPGQLEILGFFRQMNVYRLLDTYWPLLIPGIANCGAVFFLKQYLDSGLPDEIIESAFMDGCRERSIFHRIVFPLARPALITQGIMSFIGSWNSYLMPLIMLRTKEKMTMPILIATVRDTMHAEYGAQFVGMLLTVIPLVVLFCFASRVIMEEISIGAAVKG
jgi:multiple sugar transport system permease protein